jgi:alpha-L-fucosidase 2
MRGPSLALYLSFFATMATSLYARPAQTPRVRAIDDIVYSRVAGADLLMDAALPESGVPTSAVIIVHGGGWVQGDRRVDVRPLFKPLSDAGFAWFSISYRLVKDVTQFGVAIEDVESAVRYVKSHAAEFNIDPGRIALLGESAGGQLAAMAALRGGDAGSVKAVVALYAPTDLVSLIRNSNYIPPQIRDSVVGTPWERLIMAGLAQLSPIDNVRSNMPPFLFIHGTDDTLVPLNQSVEMCDRMRKAGARCEVYPVEGAGHGIRWWPTSARAAAEKKMVDWLAQELSRSAVPA